MDKFAHLGTSDIAAIDQLLKQYKQNPESVEPQWRSFFEGFEFAQVSYQIKPSSDAKKSDDAQLLDKEFKVMNLIEGYRRRGHLFTKTNPVRARRKYFPTLDLNNFGLKKDDLNTVFQAGNQIGIGAAKLSEIVEHLEETYCKSIGVEYVFIRQPEIVEWLQSKMESARNRPNFSPDEKREIFRKLRNAVGFEQFIHKKFVGQKRFALDGSESLIPALDFVIEKGAELGIEQFNIAMAHRGRLNVLANIMRKPYQNIFEEFNGKEYDENVALGDVKYHLGYDSDFQTDNGKNVRLSLAPNPSHLETVGAIIQGITRAKIYNKYNDDFSKAAPIVIHGDAAIAAQGIVYEIVQMSQLDGYRTGGTIHLVINNQVGFTTNYLDGRSSTYSTDVAKVTRSPVFHVNGDDVEALVYTIELAMEYRQRFQSDVFIDILAYRRYGHNEGDEPRFTQPTLYKEISKHPNTREIYAQQLIEQGVLTKEEIQQAKKEFDVLLDKALTESQKTDKVHIKQYLHEVWKGFSYPENKDFFVSPETGVDKQTLLELSEKINSLPAEKTFFKKIVKVFDDRKKMIENDRLDWASAELLAYATLLNEDISVRISGQDSERGTFSHRHAALTLDETAEKYFPLKHINKGQTRFHVFNSHLSEYGVLGFEYGYALATPNGLTIWEAQFGDFHNVAQAVIDQYISSAEEKWGLMNGLVLYLPHGFEGQGPEHSSSRMERFLNLAVNNNMQVVNVTTPANLFHVLRRQQHRNFRIPLVIFTPKSLLRHPLCVSPLSELAEGRFQEVIDDKDVDDKDVKRLVFCQGKIYYDLLAKKQEYNARDIAIVRIEQLHPFPQRQIRAILKKYPHVMLSLWVQEEPENMGAWNYIRNNFEHLRELEPVTRLASASPATGLNHLHLISQNEIINKVFRRCDCELKNVYCGLQCVEGKSREQILKQHRYIFENKK